MRWTRVFGLLIVTAAAAGGWWYSRPAYKPVDPALAYRVGIYRLDDGRLVDLAPLTNSDWLRWRLLDGRAGRLSRNERGGWQGRIGWSNDPDPMPVDVGTVPASYSTAIPANA